jgi:hypothetical protein
MTILTDIAQWHCAHTTECLRQNRCVCGHDRRREQDFDAQLRRAMEKHPEQSNPQEQSMTKQLAPHQQRVVDEKADLDAKREKLGQFKTTDIFAALPWQEQERLNTQAHIMTMYSAVLGERIAAFGA